jgi:hypothetical protein
MIFKNKKAYVINRHYDNDLNPESYDLVTNNDFVFEATFKLTSNKSKTSESCVMSRQGYNMGIYIYHFNDENFIKWVWWEVDEKNNHVCNEIFVHKKFDLTNITNVKVIKKDNEFSLFVNGEFYETKEITNNLFDYADKLMYVGVSDPNGIDNNGWFNGEIYDIKIYDSIDENINTLYLWFDFENNSVHKIFDKSGNKNDGNLFEELIKKVKKDEVEKIKREIEEIEKIIIEKNTLLEELKIKLEEKKNEKKQKIKKIKEST